MNPEITQLLRESETGDPVSLNQLFSMVYDDLHVRAQVFFRSESAMHTLQPTALVHEAFLKMVDQRQANWHDRAHFFRVAALVMRRILVDHARHRMAARRGDGVRPQSLDPETTTLSAHRIDDVLLVDQLLSRLADEDPNRAAIVELRFFAGMTVEEVAEALGLSRRTVEAEWTLIRALLRAEISRTKA